MNVREVKALICGELTGSQMELLDVLVAERVIEPDPLPRPDFADMAPGDLLSWIYQNGDHDETQHVWAVMNSAARRIANGKGLT